MADLIFEYLTQNDYVCSSKNDYDSRSYQFYRLRRISICGAEFHFKRCKKNQNH